MHDPPAHDLPVFGTREPGRDYVYRPSAYVIVRDASGSVAVVRTPRGCFLPGGGIDPGESAEDAVHRETREEAGLLLAALVQLGRARELVRSIDHDDVWYEKASTFFASSVAGTAASSEHDHELLWMSHEAALAALTPDSHRWALERAT